jgi:RNA polymerase sigma-70 factor (ECF subfamily)
VVTLTRQGQEFASRELVIRYQAQVYSLIYHIITRTATSEDAAQVTFLQAFDALDQCCPDFRFAPWLLKIAENVAHDFERDRPPAMLSIDGAPNAMTPKAMAATAIDVVDPGEDPLHQLLSGELSGEIEQALGQLKPKYQQCIILRYFERKSMKKIGEMMGTSERTAETNIGRSRAQLLFLLEQIRN